MHVVAVLGATGRLGAIYVARAFLLVSVVAGCATASPEPTRVPRVTIQNDSGTSVDIVEFSHRSGTSTKTMTLGDGGTYGSEPAGAECDAESSYFVEIAGRRIATLDRPGCIGATLVITPQMLLTPNVDSTASPS